MWDLCCCANAACSGRWWFVGADPLPNGAWWVTADPAHPGFLIAALWPICPVCGADVVTRWELEGVGAAPEENPLAAFAKRLPS